MKPNEQITETKTLTETHISVLITIGMIGAFFVGMGILMSFSRIAEEIPSRDLVIIPAEKKLVRDIDYITAQIDPATIHTTDSLGYLKIFGLLNGSNNVDFGQYNFDGANLGFNDLDIATSSIPLAIQVSPGTHPAMHVTIHTPGTNGGSSEIPDNEQIDTEARSDFLSSLFKINEANALVVEPPTYPETFSICIPEKTAAKTIGKIDSSNSFGIKAADAIVVDPNQSFSYYYVDVNGNTFYDMELTQRANTEDCNSYTDRALNFNDFNWGIMTPENPAEYLEFTLSKGWDISLVLAGYNKTIEGFEEVNIDEVGVQSPLFLGGNAGAGESGSFLIESFVLTMNTDEGIKNLCFPETIDDDNFFYYFYDNNGTPYNDMLLTDMVTNTPCNEILANTYTPTVIYGGVLNTPYNLDDYGFVNLRLSLMRDNNVLATLKTEVGYYEGHEYIEPYPSYNDPNEAHADSQSPFYLMFGSDDNSDQIYLEENIINIGADDEENPIQATLCVPTTTIPSHNDATVDYAPVIYYYDDYGTPYYDALLTNMVMDTGCGELLADAYTPEMIIGGQFSSMLQIDDISFNLLEINLLRNGQNLAYIDTSRPNDGVISPYPSYNEPNTAHTDSKEPLSIRFGSSDNANNALHLPNTLLDVAVTDNIDEPFVWDATLCIPETTIPGRLDPNLTYTPIYYYFDKDGNPYLDPLLTTRAITEDCVEIKEMANVTQTIYSGNFSGPIQIDQDISLLELNFIRGSVDHNLAWIHREESNNGIIYPYPDSQNPNSTWEESYVPLHLRLALSDNALNDATIEEDVVNLSTNDLTNPTTISLCVPETTLNVGELPVLYFYDMYGAPYSDPFLTTEVACGTPPDTCGWADATYCTKYPTHDCCKPITDGSAM